MKDESTADASRPERRFTVRTEALESPGWRRDRVTVLDRGEPCGSYERNYGNAEGTFEPFAVGDEWFALYSRDYTATRIMRLPSCEDVGGEEPDSWGFCPVELHVPRYRALSYVSERTWRDGERVPPFTVRTTDFLWPGDPRLRGLDPADPTPPFAVPGTGALGPWTHCPFGFVAGCVWGDDSSLKLEFLDLSRAAEGVLRRDDRFGYVELPGRLTLREAIDLSGWRPDGERARVSFARVDTHDLRAPPPADEPSEGEKT